MSFKAGLGQDSHRFEEGTNKPLILGGIKIPSRLPLRGNSDSDVVLHALCNAISSISGKNILGRYADRLCKEGITDSKIYVKEALKTLKDYRITHVSIAIECLRPKISPHLGKMRSKIAEILEVKKNDVGITVTTGEGLSEFGQGKGIQALVVVTTIPLSSSK
ncbi:TPA: 2-C-methyl-D-erythritol 2,4-cyclodiphosphate synthase [bacterium]|nr:2-C-methyl-D-erythritol 2,4-cyclodiphosphate synthase [bacterium]